MISTDTAEDTDSANPRVLAALSGSRICLTEESRLGVRVLLEEGLAVSFE